jgi:hypothetical protein
MPLSPVVLGSDAVTLGPAATNGDFLCSVKTVTATVPSASDRDQSACDGRNCSNAKHEMRDTSTATPSLLLADSQVRSQSSMSSAHCGPIMWVLDCAFALCRALVVLTFLAGFVTRPVSIMEVREEFKALVEECRAALSSRGEEND